MLASGSRDTDVIVWDVVGETGIFRLRGHHNQVSAQPVELHAGGSELEDGLSLGVNTSIRVGPSSDATQA